MIIIVTTIIIIYVYLHSRKNKHQTIEEDISHNLLSSYKEALLNIMKDVVDEIDMCDISNEEELLEILLTDITDKFICLLIQEESDKVLSIINESTIDEYVSNTFVSKYNIREIYYNNKIKYKVKENKYDEELGVETVPNHIKSDSSTIDITEDLNGIFFGDNII